MENKRDLLAKEVVEVQLSPNWADGRLDVPEIKWVQTNNYKFQCNQYLLTKWLVHRHYTSPNNLRHTAACTVTLHKLQKEVTPPPPSSPKMFLEVI